VRTVLTLLLLILNLLNLFGANPELKNGVIYLFSGEVYFCDLNHQKTVKLTNTNNNVSHFAISPDYRFLAYSKIFKSLDEPELWDSITAKKPANSVTLYDLKSDKIIREIFSSDYEWIVIDDWLNSKELICASADGSTWDDRYKINTAGIIDTLDYDRYKSIFDLNNFSPQDLKMQLIKDSLAHNHYLDFKNIKNITYSKDGKYSHVEAVSSDDKSFLWSETFTQFLKEEIQWQWERGYHLYLYNLVSGEDKLIINKDISPAILYNKIQFSPDNSMITCDWSHSDSISIYFLNAKKHIDLLGTKSIWIDSNRLFYLIDTNVYLYDIDKNISTQFLEDVREARYIK